MIYLWEPFAAAILPNCWHRPRAVERFAAVHCQYSLLPSCWHPWYRRWPLPHDPATASSTPRSLLPSTSARPSPSDETAADHPTRPSIEQPKPRAGISSLLSLPSPNHNLHGASPTGVGRPTFSARSTDDHNGAHRHGLLLPPPSPMRSALSQPAAAAPVHTPQHYIFCHARTHAYAVHAHSSAVHAHAHLRWCPHPDTVKEIIAQAVVIEQGILTGKSTSCIV